MKMQLNIILTLVVLLLTSGTAKAQLGQESRVATTAAPFLTLGVGAKGTSLALPRHQLDTTFSAELIKVFGDARYGLCHHDIGNG